MIFELSVIGIIALIAVLILSAMIFVVGLPFGVGLDSAILLAIYGLVALFPGGANLWIACLGPDGEDFIERALAAIRGVVMIVGWTTVIFLLGSDHPLDWVFPWVAGVCAVLFFWTVWGESRYQRKEQERKGWAADE